MAEQAITPEALANFLEMTHGSLNFGGTISPSDLERIRNARGMTEAVRIARQAGVDNTGLAFWDDAVRQAEQEIKSPLISANAPLVEEGDTPDDVLDSANQTLSQMTDTADWIAFKEQNRMAGIGPEEEFVPPQSPLMFFGMGGPNPDAAAHIALVSSDAYSPWGPAMSRQEMSTFIDINVPGFSSADREDADYWREQMSTVGAYASGDELLAYSQLPGRHRQRLEQKFVEAGLLDTEDDVLGYDPGVMGLPQLKAMRTAMSVGTYYGVGYETGLNMLIADKKRQDRLDAARGGGGGSRAKFSVPASLREIPDYPSISQEVTNMFRQRLGRDLEDYEVAVLADELQAQYRTQNSEKIKAARAAFYQAQGGGSGVMEVEVPNPQLRTQRFIEDRYGSEIDRYDQIDDTSVTNRLMIEAMTRGAGMVSS